MTNRKRRQEVIYTRGDYRLARIRDQLGSYFALLEKGNPAYSEADGDAFYEAVGRVSAAWEMWLMTQPPDDASRTETHVCDFCKQGGFGTYVDDGYWCCEDCQERMNAEALDRKAE
jgi:hypothetical protein